MSAATKDAAGNTLTGRSVAWASSDPSRATVSATGLVTAAASGDVAITATSEGQTGTAELTVTASASAIPTIYTERAAFRRATAALGTATIVDFDDIDARPVTNTIAGRRRFRGDRYAGQGFRFASPEGDALYIAPGGLPWNASNSLSVGRFPFDPLDIGPIDPADSLTVALSPGCAAISFQLVDNATQNATEIIEFVGVRDKVLERAEFPADYTGGRAFIGLVSTALRVARITVTEDANDQDDLTYDDFTCFRPR